MTDTTILIVRELLIDKSTHDHNLFFEKLLEQDDFQTESILIDFETDTIKSVKEKLPTVVHEDYIISTKNTHCKSFYHTF